MPDAFAKPIAGGRAGVGDRHDEVGLDRRLLREPLPHAHAARVHLRAAEARVRAGEVDVLEDARRAAALGERLGAVQPFVVEPEDLARAGRRGRRRRRSGRARSSPRRRPSRRRCGRGRAAGSRAGRGTRPCPVDDRDDRVGALEPPHGRWRWRPAAAPGRARCSAAITSVSEVEARRTPSATSSSRSGAGVREVAVVPERDGARAPMVHERLRVRPVHAAGGRVPRVPDRDLAGQRLQLLLVEDLGHEAHVAQRGQPPGLGDGDARRLLAAVLQARTARSRRAAPRRVRPSGCRTRRTSSSHGSQAARRSRERDAEDLVAADLADPRTRLRRSRAGRPRPDRAAARG